MRERYDPAMPERSLSSRWLTPFWFRICITRVPMLINWPLQFFLEANLNTNIKNLKQIAGRGQQATPSAGVNFQFGREGDCITGTDRPRAEPDASRGLTCRRNRICKQDDTGGSPDIRTIGPARSAFPTPVLTQM
jgi:hypothetical protein